MLRWSSHQHAPYYLAGVSFAESSFFPIPPDVMLISMGLAKPKNSWLYALITTVFSVLGGIFGYIIGHFFMEIIYPFLVSWGWHDHLLTIENWFKEHGIVVIFIAGFSPIPYKLFTIAAGAMSMALAPFIFASFIGRGLRFFLVSGIMFYMGEKLHAQLHRYIDFLGWSILLIIVAIVVYVKWM